jgi:hypothetical protein
MTELAVFLPQSDTGLAMSSILALKTSNEFSMYIGQSASDNRMSHLDAVLIFCQEHHLEPADIASKITKSLKAKLEEDFRELNYLPPKAQLEL